MSIKIINNIEDVYLKENWERIEKNNNTFPQMTYDWCSTWCKYLLNNRKIHIVLSIDKLGNVQGIAPFCIEKNVGISVLRSIPINFGDYYSFIVEKIKEEEIIDEILEYLRFQKEWKWVRIDKINDSSNRLLFNKLEKSGYKKKWLTDCITADFEGLTWDNYFSFFSKKKKKRINYLVRKINRNGNIKFNIIDEWKEYEPFHKRVREVYNKRWGYKDKSFNNQKEKCWKNGIKKMFIQKCISFYYVSLDNDIVAYCLCFRKNRLCYYWHTSFNNEYYQFSPGIILLYYLTQHLILHNKNGINFMGGTYKWKTDWSARMKIDSNYMMSHNMNNILGSFFNTYYHQIRDHLKKMALKVKVLKN